MDTQWNQRIVLVTGATGLVGSWLAKALIERKAQVIALIRDLHPQSEFILSGADQKAVLISGSLEDFNGLERIINKYEIDTVFHLGAQTIVGTSLRNPLSTFEANIRGTYHLLDACRRFPGLVKRVVIASSDKAYGSSSVLPYTETMPLAGRSPYDVSKSCADLLASAYFHTYQLPVTIIRCGNIYGGGDLNWSRIIPGTIRSLLRNETPVIRSDGKFTRDYLYVEDAVEGYLAVGQKESRGESFNFGPNQPHSVLEIVKTIQGLMDRLDLEPEILNGANGEIRDQFLDSGKASEWLGWKPRFSLVEGLKKTIAWYEMHTERLAEVL